MRGAGSKGRVEQKRCRALDSLYFGTAYALLGVVKYENDPLLKLTSVCSEDGNDVLKVKENENSH